jgi:hypothetical protein
VASPMPDEAPVMTMTCSASGFSFRGMGRSCLAGSRL